MSDTTTHPEGRFEPHVPEFKDEKAVLKFTQNLRLQIIQTKTHNGANIDALTDDDISIVLQAANDIDRQNLTAMKLKADDANADADRKVAMMAAMLNQKVVTNPFELKEAQADRAPPAIDVAQLEIFEVSDDSMEIGIIEENSVDFFKRFE